MSNPPVYSEKDIRVLEVTSLLEHPGMYHLKQLFKEHMEDENYMIDRLLSKPITNDLREELNFHINRKNIARDYYENITDFLVEYLKRKSPNSTESDGA